MKTLLATISALLVASAQADVEIASVEGQSAFILKHGKLSDLSGITWVRGEDFVVVSNREQALIPLKLGIRPSGAIRDATVGQKTLVKSRVDDFEGVAYWPERDRLYVSTERPPAIVGFNREGDAAFYVEVPKIFARARPNKGLESLAYGAGAFWTANEDALQPDGEVSSARQGAFIRIQKLDERFKPVAQFAYRTEPSLLRVGKSGTGVTDLLALADGSVLALERVVGLGLSVKIFQITTEGATDTSALSGLAQADITPVRKKLLYERSTGGKNFEGLAIGPDLEDGWRSLILIEDSGGGSDHTLIPLRIKVGAAE